MVCQGAKWLEGRYVDPRQHVSFLFDHMSVRPSARSLLGSNRLTGANGAAQLEPSDVRPLPLDDPTETMRSALESVFSSYVSNHYAAPDTHAGSAIGGGPKASTGEAVSMVYALKDDDFPDEVWPPPPPPAAREQADPAVEEHAPAPVAETSAEKEDEPMPSASQDGGEGEGAPPQTDDDDQMPVSTPEPEAEATADDESRDAEGDKRTDDDTDDKTHDVEPAPAAAGGDEAKAPESEPEAEAERKAEMPARQSRRFGLYLVGNRYNPGNYWCVSSRLSHAHDSSQVLNFTAVRYTGRDAGARSMWPTCTRARSRAESTSSCTTTSKVRTRARWARWSVTDQLASDVDRTGNVQLSTDLTSSTEVPKADELAPHELATRVVAAIKRAETAAHDRITSGHARVTDDELRALRRALPKTKTKLDWNRVASYRLGTELAGAK